MNYSPEIGHLAPKGQGHQPEGYNLQSFIYLDPKVSKIKIPIPSKLPNKAIIRPKPFRGQLPAFSEDALGLNYPH